MIRSFVIGVAALLASTSIASAQPAYQQPGTEACNPSCWTSHYASGNGFRSYDNFTLASATSIGSVTWQGIYIPTASSPTPPAPNTDTWDLGFFADGGNFPGAQLYNVSLPSASVVQTFLGTGTFGSQAVNLYSFSAALPSAFVAAAGTQYWFSPLSQAATFDPFFSWSPSTLAYDGLTAQTDTGGGTFNRPNDRAFSLSAVPEPATWAIMIIGFGAVGASMRRRSRQTLAHA